MSSDLPPRGAPQLPASSLSDSPSTPIGASPAPHVPADGSIVAPTAREAWPPWRWWEALAAIAVLAVSQVALGVLAGALLRRFGPPDFSDQVAIALPVLVVGSHAITWTAVAWILWRRRVGFRAALRIEDAPRLRLLKIWGAGVGLYGLMLPLLALFPPAKDQTNLFTDIFRKGGPALIALAVTAVVLAPALEETLFRGLLFPAWRRQWKFWPAAIAVTAIFTALHIAQTGLYWPALAGIFACGMVLAGLRERTGFLWPSIAFHMGFNCTPFLIWLAALPFGGLPEGPLG